MSKLTINALKDVTPRLIQDLGMQYPTITSKKKARYGLYKCDCGVIFKTITSQVKRGKTVSCGCYRKAQVKKANSTHGLSVHPLYQTWSGIVKRCTKPSSKDYKNYGARGITVTDRWLDVSNFIEDMYPTYKEGLTIDRIDNDKGYSKENCRWATSQTQGSNTRVLQINNTSGYRGVSYCKHAKKWEAGIKVNNRKTRIGYFDTALEGAKAYDAYVIENNLEHNINGITIQEVK